MAGDSLIRGQALVLAVRSERVFDLELPNGKVVIGHRAKTFPPESDALATGDRVEVEMTPYDFSKARIVSRVANRE